MPRNLFRAAVCVIFFGLVYPGYLLGYGLQDYKPVCYFLLSNEIERDIREIRIFINEADFTEDNLKVLIRHFL